MTITATSPFQELSLQWSLTSFTNIGGSTDESPSQSASISLGSALSSDAEALLETLQEIYASDDGFQDTDGNDIVVNVWGLEGIGITNADQLEPNGYSNPFIAGWEDRERNRQQVEGAFLQEATVERDADTGRPDIKSGAGWVPKNRVPDGTLSQSLEDWRLVSNGNNFTWRLDLTEEDAPTDAEFTAPAPIQALLEWWSGLRDFGGFNVNTSAVTRAEFFAAIAGSRVYALEQSTGNSVGWHVFALVTSNDNRTIEIVCQWSTTSDEHDAQAINDILNSTAVDIETDHPVEKPPLGRLGNPLHASRLYLGSEHVWVDTVADSPRFHGRDVDGHAFDVVLGYGRSIGHAALPVNADGDKIFRLPYGINAVHLTGSANARARLVTPPEFIPVETGDRPLLIHNRGTGNYTIADWDDDDLFVLLPGERAELLMIRRGDGSGELLNKTPLVRTFKAYGDNVGSFSSVNYYALVSNYRLRPIPFPNPAADSDDTVTYHADAFEIGTQTFASGTGFFGIGNVHVPQAQKLLKAGHIRYEIELGIGYGSSGWVGSGHGLRLYRQRGTDERLVRNPEQRGQGSYDNASWSTFWEGDIEANDVMVPGFYYDGSSTTMPMDSIIVPSYKLEIFLEQVIAKEYIP